MPAPPSSRFVFDGTAAFQGMVFGGDDTFIGSRFADVLIGYEPATTSSRASTAPTGSPPAAASTGFGGSGDDLMTGEDGDWLFGGNQDDLWWAIAAATSCAARTATTS